MVCTCKVTDIRYQRTFPCTLLIHRQADAVDARMELDLRIGAAFTRFQTLRLQARFPDLENKTISYGA